MPSFRKIISKGKALRRRTKQRVLQFRARQDGYVRLCSHDSQSSREGAKQDSCNRVCLTCAEPHLLPANMICNQEQSEAGKPESAQKEPNASMHSAPHFTPYRVCTSASCGHHLENAEAFCPKCEARTRPVSAGKHVERYVPTGYIASKHSTQRPHSRGSSSSPGRAGRDIQTDYCPRCGNKKIVGENCWNPYCGFESSLSGRGDALRSNGSSNWEGTSRSSPPELRGTAENTAPSDWEVQRRISQGHDARVSSGESEFQDSFAGFSDDESTSRPRNGNGYSNTSIGSTQSEPQRPESSRDAAQRNRVSTPSTIGSVELGAAMRLPRERGVIFPRNEPLTHLGMHAHATIARLSEHGQHWELDTAEVPGARGEVIDATIRLRRVDPPQDRSERQGKSSSAAGPEELGENNRIQPRPVQGSRFLEHLPEVMGFTFPAPPPPSHMTRNGTAGLLHRQANRAYSPSGIPRRINAPSPLSRTLSQGAPDRVDSPATQSPTGNPRSLQEHRTQPLSMDRYRPITPRVQEHRVQPFIGAQQQSLTQPTVSERNPGSVSSTQGGNGEAGMSSSGDSAESGSQTPSVRERQTRGSIDGDG